MHLLSPAKTNFWLSTPVFFLLSSNLLFRCVFLLSVVLCLVYLFSMRFPFVSLFLLTADIRHLRRFVRDDHFFSPLLVQAKQKNCVVIFVFFSSLSLSLLLFITISSLFAGKANLINRSARFHFFVHYPSFILCLCMFVFQVFICLFFCLFYVSFFARK